ncbi:MAG: hypothetical protein LAT78_14030 [Roseinatronobacter sp.]|nr:hypothetical protein [Roseinatronobacter sp.]
MTTLFIADDYEALLSPLRDGIRPTLSNDTLQLLENFSLAESDGTITGVSLDANGLTVTATSLDPSDSTIYTVRISGSGIAPVTSLDGLREALDAGTANGSINQISIDYGAQRVAQFDIAPGSLALSSGTQRLELTGGFPVTLTDIITFADTLFGEIDGTLDAYAFTGMTLTDNNQQIFNISLDDGSLRLEYEGFTIVAEDFSLSLQDVFTFLEPPRGQIIPQLRLLDSEGNEVLGQVFSFSNDEPNALRVGYANLAYGHLLRRNQRAPRQCRARVANANGPVSAIQLVLVWGQQSEPAHIRKCWRCASKH